MRRPILDWYQQGVDSSGTSKTFILKNILVDITIIRTTIGENMNLDFWRAAILPPIVKNAVRVSLTVGTVLNLINQGGPVLSGAPISWINVLLNYLVPYCVSSYSAAKNQTRAQ